MFAGMPGNVDQLCNSFVGSASASFTSSVSSAKPAGLLVTSAQATAPPEGITANPPDDKYSVSLLIVRICISFVGSKSASFTSSPSASPEGMPVISAQSVIFTQAETPSHFHSVLVSVVNANSEL